jgi:carbonic anhydrase
VEWSHNGGDAERGPKAWGGIDESFVECRTGQEQSPVDIASVADADLPPLEFDYPITPLTVENTGHTIEATLPEDTNLTLTVGDDVYRLEQFHVHAPSEHTVEGKSYPAELHLVHRSEAGEIAVVGIFIESSSLPTPLIDTMLEIAGGVGEEVPMPYPETPLELLLDIEGPRSTIDRYYTYPGSLTTPPCTENVRWIVLRDIHVVDLATVDYFHDVVSGFPAYEGYANNNRPAQPLNGRQIQRSGG